MLGEKYRVIRLLMSGGMGSVYEAENTWTKRPVALKVLHPDRKDREQHLERFLQEARAAGQLRHPHIVEVLDLGREKGDEWIYIVQELLKGRDLYSWLREVERVPVREALEVIVPILHALGEAHAQGIIHRDLKPENIFLEETPTGIAPKLIDFGVARFISDEDRVVRTRDGTLLGTVHYMSPEQARGDGSLDARSDLWSIGVVLYELLSGRRPFEGNIANVVIARILSDVPEPIERFRPDLPEPVRALVHKALERDRDERYASADAFLRAALACAALDEGEPTPFTRSCDNIRALPEYRAIRSVLPPAAPPPPAVSAPPPQASPATQSEVPRVASSVTPPPITTRSVLPVLAVVIVLTVGVLLAVLWAGSPGSR
jgi:serine/threonine-protein kinase